jgi:hypothetical protein
MAEDMDATEDAESGRPGAPLEAWRPFRRPLLGVQLVVRRRRSDRRSMSFRRSRPSPAGGRERPIREREQRERVAGTTEVADAGGQLNPGDADQVGPPALDRLEAPGRLCLGKDPGELGVTGAGQVVPGPDPTTQVLDGE